MTSYALGLVFQLLGGGEHEESPLRSLAAGAIAVVAAPVAGAGQPDNPNCFGKGASQLGQAGEMGTHSSSFDEPRSGIGNVAFENTGTHQPGELGIALGADCG